jgi:primosomal protein N' (replication factor Y) (superfamily II helicase)
MQKVEKTYIQVILPVPLGDFFTYHANQEEREKLKVGQRVAVAFGKNKTYTGIVYALDVPMPELYKTKEILYILDVLPIVSLHQLNLWKWVAAYYVCSMGDIFRNLFPSALRLESETFVKATEVSIDFIDLSEKELLMINLIKSRQMMAIKELEVDFLKKEILPLLHSLLTKKLIQIDEKLVQRYKKKYQKFISINSDLLDNSKNNAELFKYLEKTPKQREVLLKLLSQFLQENKPIGLTEFIKQNQTTPATLKSLEEKSLIYITDTEILRHQKQEKQKAELEQLSINQKKQLTEIENKLVETDILLLEHELFSEKEKILFRLINNEIKIGGKVLYLLPNVSQADWFYDELNAFFPNQVVCYHSGMSQNKNAEAYLGVLHNKYSIVVGVRSVPFLAFDSLSLVIVEQEQEILYKQREPKPYFHARDVAIFLSHIHQAKCILTSVAPSVESFSNVQENKYAYFKLSTEHKKSIPKIQLIDLKNAYKKKLIKGTVTQELELAIREELKKGKNVVIYQNRKGYAPVLECEDCGHTAYCPNCDVSLTYYKEISLLKCHYCGHVQEKPSKCFRCQSKDLHTHGIGIEQIEKDLKEIFPNKSVVKLSADSVNKKFYFEKIIDDFEEGKIDILIGTQLLLRLKSFENVGLLALIKIDADLNHKNIKAHENSYQNLLRLAELMPKNGVESKILLQTMIPDHQVLQNLSVYNYKEVMQNLLYDRKNYHYPPYVKLIQIRVKHKKSEWVDKAATHLKYLLSVGIKDNLLGPEKPVVSKIRNEFIKNILIKIGPEKSNKKIKEYIRLQSDNLQKIAAFKTIKIEIDIDPTL